jgi:hypothetical protein
MDEDAAVQVAPSSIGSIITRYDPAAPPPVSCEIAEHSELRALKGGRYSRIDSSRIGSSH